tara:strand:- start:20 stop:1045 length:1026 start_codon:yes stop_codon:yes gene_type:complete
MIKINKDILLLLIFIFILLFLWHFSNILISFFVAIFVAYLLDPLVDLLEEKKLGRTLATTLVLFFFFLGFLLISFLILPILVQQIREFLNLFPNLIDETERIINLIIGYIRNFFFNYQSEEILLDFKNNFYVIFDKLFNNVMLSSFAVINLLGIVLITPIITWYTLKDWDKIIGSIEKNLPKKHKKNIKQNIKEIDAIFSIYFRGQFLVSVSLTVFYSICFFIIDLNYSIFLGLFTGFLSLIPLIGILISFIISILLAFLQFYDYIHLLYIIFIFIFGQLLESYILTPKIIGKKLGIHPVVIILSIIVFGSIFGILGVFFAIPLTAIIIIYSAKLLNYLNR